MSTTRIALSLIAAFALSSVAACGKDKDKKTDPAPKVEPRPEEPKPEPPKPEEPRPEEPKTEQPKPEEPKTEQPK